MKRTKDIDDTLKAVGRWLDLRKQYDDSNHVSPGRVDLEHSALLSRLLDGQEPFDEPPPTRFSYPWYKLMEDGHADVVEIHEHQSGLVLDQSIWEVISKPAENEWVVAYSYYDRYANIDRRLPNNLVRASARFRVVKNVASKYGGGTIQRLP